MAYHIPISVITATSLKEIANEPSKEINIRVLWVVGIAGTYVLHRALLTRAIAPLLELNRREVEVWMQWMNTYEVSLATRQNGWMS